jgi:nitrous oxidase accessory protein
MGRCLGVVGLGFFLLFSPFYLKGATIEVCENCPQNTIHEGLKKAQAHDTVLVKKDVYQEGNIPVKKPVTLVGKKYPVVDGEGKTEIFTIKADNVTIKGFQVQNVGTSYTVDRAGIRVANKENCLIANNKLINTFFGIYLEKADSCIIRNNTVIGDAEKEVSSGNAIHLWYSNHSLVEGNMTRNHRDGIYFEFVEHSTIRNNISRNNLRYGLHFMFSHYDKYINNTFKNNGAGVAVMFSKHIHMRKNLFIRNWGDAAYGLYLKEINDAVIQQNRFVNNTYGIYFEGSNKIEVKKNAFIDNGWAIDMLGNCYGNTVMRNNFIGNNFDVSTNTTSARSNVYKYNFWDKYTGYDMNDDGYGDVPYRPVKVFSYITNKTNTALILMRSLFVDLMNYAEKVYPVFTPKELKDKKPLMNEVDIL